MHFNISSGDTKKVTIDFYTTDSEALDINIYILLIFDTALNCWVCNFKVYRRCLYWSNPWQTLVEVSTSAESITEGVDSALQEVTKKLINHEIEGSNTEWVYACQLVDDFRRYFATFKIWW